MGPYNLTLKYDSALCLPESHDWVLIYLKTTFFNGDQAFSQGRYVQMITFSFSSSLSGNNQEVAERGLSNKR